MPKRTDIRSILIIGAGPIVIGQACEFDYSGTQACRALKKEGYKIILVNSNPATIMTDPSLADATYIEPVTQKFVEKIIAREKPDALLPTMGGQTALNVAFALHKSGVLERYGVEMIGADATAIAKAEERQQFRDAMAKIGLQTPRGVYVRAPEEVEGALKQVGLPVIVRPSYTLGGEGGGVAYTVEAAHALAKRGLAVSPTGEILMEESVLGWKEYEMEVVRDKADNCIIVCAIENVDPMGVHTGDSITVAPALTLTDKEYQRMRSAAIAILREIGVETGGSNVQFALNPHDGRMVVIEMNPRVSRSSALASKATGFPIARVAARLAVGYTLDELPNEITGGVIPASFEPTIDYVVVKLPRFTFEKFPASQAVLDTSMKSVGEVMAIGRTFLASLQKAFASLELKLSGLDEVHTKDIKAALRTPTPKRLRLATQALRQKLSTKEICAITHYDPWFLEQLEDLVTLEEEIKQTGLPQTPEKMLVFKAAGFTDARLGILAGLGEEEVRRRRHALGVRPVFRRVDTCAGEFEAHTPYLYSAYERGYEQGYGQKKNFCEAAPSDRRKVMILGGGPNRIGQGIEFDYCCCHAAFALRDAGIESIMVNCNPETVSTDFDTSDRLYFEPLTTEHVLEIIETEKQKGEFLGIVVQFGGQTPLKLAGHLEAAGVPILGTPPASIHLAEDRERFQELIQTLGLRQPQNGIARSVEEAKTVAENLGYPVVLRPSYVLGGRGMEIVAEASQLTRYMQEAVGVSTPVLIDRYLEEAIEVDVDALCDGKETYVAGIMEHIESAGVHSGDSACSLPPHSLSQTVCDELKRQTQKLAQALGVVGLMNIQFAVRDEEVYVLEVNPRASRTVPFVSKATSLPLAGWATRLMLGTRLSEFSFPKEPPREVAVKESVFPFSRFPGVDTVLGPEMRSTGEVMGSDKKFPLAFAKSQLAAGGGLPRTGTVFVSVRDADKAAFIKPVRALVEMGFCILATGGTAQFLQKHGLVVEVINKVRAGSPHIVDAIKDKRVHLVFNTTQGERSLADSLSIRRTALLMNIPYCTTRGAAQAAVAALVALRKSPLTVCSLQEKSIDL